MTDNRFWRCERCCVLEYIADPPAETPRCRDCDQPMTPLSAEEFIERTRNVPKPA